jgi:hypothetical protein
MTWGIGGPKGSKQWVEVGMAVGRMRLQVSVEKQRLEVRRCLTWWCEFLVVFSDRNSIFHE